MKSPCVGLCSTTFGDPVCRGCKRYQEEVLRWNLMSEASREAVWQRLWVRQTAIVDEYLVIREPQVLQEQLSKRSIRSHAMAPLEVKVMDLLRVGCQKMRDLSAYGLELKPAHKGLSIVQLFNTMNQRLYADAVEAWELGL